MKADDQRRARRPQRRAQLLQLPGSGLLGRLDLQIDYLASGFGSLGQHLQFSLERPLEAAAILFAAAGGDDRRLAMRFQELLHPGQHRGRLGQRIEAQFEKAGIHQRRCRPLDQLRRRGCLNGHAQLAQIAQAQSLQGRRGRGLRRIRTENRHKSRLSHLIAI